MGDHRSARRRVPAGAPAFVAAKIATPSLGPALVRPDVLARIAAGAAKRLLIVRAPAGYGKTAVIAEAARRLGWRAVWYRIDVLDHDPAVFVASLVQAVRDRVPGFGDILMERFAEAHETPMSPAEMVALFVSELRDEVDAELHIVVDDYQQAIASAELNRALDYVLANLPPLVHLILLTRFQPTLATARLKLEDTLSEVTFEDLRLEPPQVAELFAQRSSVRLDRDQADRLVEITEGWPASLVLISRALDWTSLGSIASALVDPRLTSDVFSYLSEEAFRREDAETVAFLLATCCLESMTIELADTVARTDHARRSLERLVAHNVFTFVDRATGTYRYHQLLRDYLQQWYANEYGADAFRSQQLHTAASVEDAGDPETAIELYFAANEPERALGVVSRSGELVTDNCRFGALQSWLERLVPSTSPDDPWVLFLAGQLALREGDSTQALAALTKAEAHLRARDDRWGVYHALSAIEAIWFWKGDFEQSARYCEAALEAATTTEQRVHTLVSLSSARSYVCRWPDAEDLWRRARASADPTCARELVRIAALEANSHYLRGAFRLAHGELKSALALAIHTGPRTLAVSLMGAVVDIDRDLALYGDARAEAHIACAECDRIGFGHFRHMFDESLYRLDCAEGEETSRIPLIEALATAPSVQQDSYSRAVVLLTLATAQRHVEELDDSLVSYREAASIGKAIDAHALRLSASAGALLVSCLLGQSGNDPKGWARLEQESRAFELSFTANQCIFFGAVAASHIGERHQAIECLRRCLPQQLEYGHLDFLCQEFGQWPGLAVTTLCDDALAPYRQPLLAALAHSPKSAPLFTRIMESDQDWLTELALECCDGSASANVVRSMLDWIRRNGTRRQLRSLHELLPSKRQRQSVAALTGREVEVLGLVAAGHRNPEIARRLFLSEKTVKTHINHIFTKLGVSDRVQAVLYYRAYIEPQAGQDTTEGRFTPER